MSRHHSRLNMARWRAVRRQVFNRDGWRCRACGRAGRLECDHVTPLWKDPEQDPYALDNLQAICRGCHIRKTMQENAREISPERADLQRLVAELLDG